MQNRPYSFPPPSSETMFPQRAAINLGRVFRSASAPPKVFGVLYLCRVCRGKVPARYFVAPLITTVSLLGNRLSQLIYVTRCAEWPPPRRGGVKARKLILMHEMPEKSRVLVRTSARESIFYVGECQWLMKTSNNPIRTGIPPVLFRAADLCAPRVR